MSKDEALRLALDALEYPGPSWIEARQPAITAIKDALEAKDEPMEFFDWYDNAHWGNEDFKEGCHRAWYAAIKYIAKQNQEAKDEPVAWMCADESLINKGYARFSHVCMGEWKIPVYTTPPQRTWVGLTAEEREQVQSESYGKVPHHVALIAAVEAKLKEKNT